MRWTRLVPVAAVVAVLAYFLWPVPDDVRVRRAIESAVAAFSLGHATDCIDAFDLRFTDESGPRRIDRDTIRGAVLSAFGRRPGPGTWHARIDEAGVDVVACDAAAGRASARFEVAVFRLPDGAAYLGDAEPVWVVAIDAELERGEDRAWRFVRSSHRTVSGSAPYR